MTSSALVFQNTTFDIIDRNNQPWLKLHQMADCLYPAKGGDQSDAPSENGIRQVQKLFQRHADEFTSAMTGMIEMETAGGKQQVRIFSLRGAHLLGMFARTAIAKEFRKWVLDILDKETTQQKYSVNPTDTLTLDQCDQLRNLMLEAQSKLPKELAAKFAISGWSKLRAHFGVAYRLIPQHKFQDALALLSRHVAAQPVFPRMNAGMLPDPRLLCAVNQKWLLTLDQNNEPQYTPVPHDACVMTVPRMLQAINEPNGMFVDTKTLFEFVTATVNRLAQRCEYYENKSKGTPVKLAM